MAESIAAQEAARGDIYNLESYTRPGHLIIFNHYKFACDADGKMMREGTHQDIVRLNEVFTAMRYDINTHNDFTVRQIKEKLKYYSEVEDHTECASLVMVVLTHGSKDGVLHAKDSTYHISEVWEPLVKCKTLQGKLKICIFQACRADNSDSEGRCEADAGLLKMSSLPHAKDFLLAYSTVEDRISMRNIVEGTWYIQTLCEELWDWAHGNTDLLTVLTRVTNRVVQEKKMKDKDAGQTPVFVSFLDKQIWTRSVLSVDSSPQKSETTTFAPTADQNTETSDSSSTIGTSEEKQIVRADGTVHTPGNVEMKYETAANGSSGHAVIFHGDEIVARDLIEALSVLRFRPECKQLNSQLLEHLMELSQNSSLEAEPCLIVAILAPLGEDSLRDMKLSLQKILEIFSASKCEKMIGKPKVFLFLDCSEQDNTEKKETVQEDNFQNNKKVTFATDHCDFFVLRGYNRAVATSFCSVLRSCELQSEGLVTLATRVLKWAQKVPSGYLSYIESTLTRELHLGILNEGEKTIEDEIKTLNEELKQHVINFLNEEAKKFDPEDTKSSSDRIDEHFASVLQRLFTKLTDLKNKALATYKESLQKLNEAEKQVKTRYSSSMNAEGVETEKDLELRHEELKQRVMDEFNGVTKKLNPEIKESFLERIQEYFASELQRHLKDLKAKQLTKHFQDCQENLQKMIDAEERAKNSYESSMNTEGVQTIEDIEAQHEELKKRVMGEFNEVAKNYGSEFTEPFSKRIEKHISSELKSHVNDLKARQLTQREESLQKLNEAEKQVKTRYSSSMNVEGVETEKDLELRHEELKQRVMDEFNGVTKKLNPEIKESFLERIQEYLASELQRHLKDLKARQQTKHDQESMQKLSEAEFQAKITFYKISMERKVMGAKTEEDLQDFHDDLQNRVMNEFNDVADNYTLEITQPFLNRINEDIANKLRRHLNDLKAKQLAQQESLQKLSETEERAMSIKAPTSKVKAEETVEEIDVRPQESKQDVMEESNKVTNPEIAESLPERIDERAFSKRPAVGIDLGMTFSSACVYIDGHVMMVEDGSRRTVPSVVAFTESGEKLVGKEAVLYGASHPENTVYEVQQLMGRQYNDPDVQENQGRWPFKVVGTSENYPEVEMTVGGVKKLYSPQEISAEVLKKMKNMAEKVIGNDVKITDAVITVPDYFSELQRRATRDAAEMAGLNVLQILSEPTAAVLAYDLKKKVQQTRKVLVMDVGGGTSDVSLVEIKDEEFDVKVSKDERLGGEDFDTRLVNHCVVRFKEKYSRDISGDKDVMRRLRMKCEQAKRVLSEKQSTTIKLDTLFDSDDDKEITITRKEFEDMNLDLFHNTIQLISKCLEEAKVDVEKIDDVVPVGGSMRIPRLREMLQEHFKNKPLYSFIDPDEAVACGAAVMASKNLGTYCGHIVLSDVIPFSLGVAIMLEDKMSFIIPRNTKIPCNKIYMYQKLSNDRHGRIQPYDSEKTSLFRWKFFQTWNTYRDYQKWIRVAVYQGDEPYVKDNVLLGEFNLTGLQEAEETSIMVTFRIDKDGVLTVTAQEESTKKTEMIVIEKYQSHLSKLKVRELTEKN